MFAAMKSGAPVPDIAPPPPVATQNFQRTDSSQSVNKQHQIKVFNIPEGSSQDELTDFFLSVGKVKSAKILPARDGKTTTLGFVEFEQEGDVQKAVDMKEKEEFNGSQLHVVANNRDGGMRSGTNNDCGQSPQVKVFNIPNGSDKDEIKDLFSSAGAVSNVKILACREGKDVTLGFVHFEDSEAVEKAISQFNDYDFNGSKLHVVNADRNNNPSNRFSNNSVQSPPRTSPGNFFQDEQKPSRPMGRGAQLLANVSSVGQSQERRRRPQAKVFGISPGTSEDEVKDFFSSVGTVQFVKILPLREGKDNHLGFVEFDTEEEVEKAVQELSGQDFGASTLKVMSGGGQSSTNSFSKFQQGGDSWHPNSSIPIGRIPREERAPNFMSNGHGDGDRDIMLPEYGNNACRRCGEMGHWARECTNAPASDGSLAVTYIPPPPPETEEEIFAQGIHEGINFEKYEHIPVELTGTNAPKPVSCFNDAEIHAVCKLNIGKAGYKKPTPVQKYAIPAIIKKRDLMACAQTGSGKTASFLIPIITNILSDGLVNNIQDCDGPTHPLAAILSPTRELAVQIFQEAIKFSFGSAVRPVVIYGGISVNHQLDKLRSGCHILVATPGRLDDFVKRGRISFKNLQYLVLDEADRMMDMGFGPQINAIIDNSEMPMKTERTTLMFSATFPEQIQQMAARFLHDYLFLTVGRVGGTCSDVQQTILQVPGAQKRNTLEQILQESGTDRTLVFVERKRDADFLASFLSQRNYPTTSLNADRSQQERELALRDFRAGIAPVLVATAVAGRGLDINDVKHVINYDLPNDATEYVHRIGRTGRIGNKGKATAFFDMNRDDKLARGLVKLLSDAEQTVPDWLEECALSAVGTGYGPDGGQFRDRRVQTFNRRGAPVANSNHAASRPAVNSIVDDDDDEEW